MTGAWIEGVRSLLEAPSAAVLTTYRKDGSALVSPVWFRWSDGAFEVVIAKGDLKLRHLAHDPQCVLVVFETVRPFRGVEARGIGELIDCDVGPVRAAIATAKTMKVVRLTRLVLARSVVVDAERRGTRPTAARLARER